MTLSCDETSCSSDSHVKEKIELLSRYCNELKVAVNRLDELVNVIRAKMKILHSTNFFDLIVISSDDDEESQPESQTPLPEPKLHTLSQSPVLELSKRPSLLEGSSKRFRRESDGSLVSQVRDEESVPADGSEWQPQSHSTPLQPQQETELQIMSQPRPVPKLQTLSLSPIVELTKRPSLMDRSSKRSRRSDESFVWQVRDKENVATDGRDPCDVSAILPAGRIAKRGPSGSLETRASLRRGLSSSAETLSSLESAKASGRSIDTVREWGVEGTMVKILGALRAGPRPVTVHSLVAAGPAPHSRRALIAAKCFTSVIKLKQHGFIHVTKEANSMEIKAITLGPRFYKIFF